MGPAIEVWIEAESAAEANRLAQYNGLYFDGVDDGIDCDCCGDRWYSADECDAYHTPAAPDKWTKDFAKTDSVQPSIVIRKD